MTNKLAIRIAKAADIDPRTIYKTLESWKKSGLIDILEKEAIARLNNSKPKSIPLVPCRAKTKTNKRRAKLVLAQNSFQ